MSEFSLPLMLDKKMEEAKIIITDDLIVKYRATYELNSRVWQDPGVQRHVVSLSRQLTIAKMAGWEHIVTDITATLIHLEPLHEIPENSYASLVLQIAFTYYCIRDLEASMNTVEAALKHFPNDTRFQRMQNTLRSLQAH